MDVNQILKELDQKTTKYKMNKGALQGVLDYDPQLDLESGPEEPEDERDTKNCTRKEIGCVMCITPLVLGASTLFGWFIYRYVSAAVEVFNDSE